MVICIPGLNVCICTVDSGEKQKFRKEMIAAKRRDRMIRRGVDLQKINLVRQKLIWLMSHLGTEYTVVLARS